MNRMIKAAGAFAAFGMSISCASVAPNCACAQNPDHPGCNEPEEVEQPTPRAPLDAGFDPAGVRRTGL